MTKTSCTLTWHSDRGFELGLDAANDEITVRLEGVPVPVDGTREFAAGAELDRLDILFKADVDVEGQPGQLQEVRVVLEGLGPAAKLFVDAKVEDVETGSIIPFQVRIPVDLPAGIPESGGPRPTPQDEDELDWEDETTLEQMIVNAPETTSSHPPPPQEGAGLQALLKALAELPTDGSEAELAPEADDAHSSVDLEPDPLFDRAPNLSSVVPETPPDALPGAAIEVAFEGDQSMSASDEARGLVELLVRGDNLELEEGFTADDLVPELVDILALPVDPSTKATRLCDWLLEQDAVADLFIADDDLATILEQW